MVAAWISPRSVDSQRWERVVAKGFVDDTGKSLSDRVTNGGNGRAEGRFGVGLFQRLKPHAHPGEQGQEQRRCLAWFRSYFPAHDDGTVMNGAPEGL